MAIVAASPSDMAELQCPETALVYVAAHQWEQQRCDGNASTSLSDSNCTATLKCWHIESEKPHHSVGFQIPALSVLRLAYRRAHLRSRRSVRPEWQIGQSTNGVIATLTQLLKTLFNYEIVRQLPKMRFDLRPGSP
jgi:hypothetical protein